MVFVFWKQELWLEGELKSVVEMIGGGFLELDSLLRPPFASGDLRPVPFVFPLLNKC